ncbi:MAG: haloacid dehalogenase [Actinomycetota bacterium]|nr:haloacid dehalogenase [Actinomycetota bacterium]
MELEKIFEYTHRVLESENHAREEGLTLCRESIRFSANAIRAIHRDNDEEARILLENSKEKLKRAQQVLSPYPRIYYAGFLQDSEKEYAEAQATIAMIEDNPVPLPEEIGVDIAPFLNGLGEAAAEIRRHILDLIRQDHLERGEEFLEKMDDIFYLLTSVDFPDALTDKLRRTTDMLRSVLERTRGDLTEAICRQSLGKRIAELENNLRKE